MVDYKPAATEASPERKGNSSDPEILSMELPLTLAPSEDTSDFHQQRQMT